MRIGARNGLITAAAVVAATLVVYWPAVHFGFINFDDEAVIVANPFLRGAWTWAALLTRARATTYAPLCWLCLWALASLLGLKAAVFHSALLLAHAACAAAVFALARELYSGPRRDLAAGFAALLFALHPVQAECVGEAACLAVVPCALLALVSTLLFLRGRKRAALAVFALCGLWHWEAVALPVALLCLGASWLDAAPFAFVSACMVIVNSAAKHATYGYSSFAARPGAAALGVLHSLGSFFWPGERLPVYLYSGSARPFGWAPLESVLVFLAVTGIAFLSYPRAWPGPSRWITKERVWIPPVAAAWVAFVAFLAPPLLLTGKDPTWGHDHFVYLAFIPLCLLAGAALSKLSLKASLAPALAVLLACSVGARRDLMLWRDGETLWRHAFAQDSSSPMFTYRLGEILLFQRGRVDEAIAFFHVQRHFDPDQSEARKVLGYAFNRRGYDLMKKGRRREAIAAFEEALRCDPGRPEIAANLATAKRQKGIIGR